MRLSLSIFFVQAIAALGIASTAHADSSPVVPESTSSKLAEAGIGPTTSGAAAYLNSQIPSEEAVREAAGWIEGLRATDFLARESAERALLATANPPVEALEKAAGDKSDPEASLRAARILRRVQTRPRTTLHLVFRWVEKSPDRSFVPPLLTLAEHAKSKIETSLIHRALAASSTSEDIALLSEAASAPSPAARSAATAGLAEIPDATAADQLARLTADEDESITLAAATALAHRGDSRSLPPLGKLLLSDSTAIRMRSHHLLSTVTGKKFEFSAYASDEDRAAAAQKILDWIAGEGATAELDIAKNRPGEAIYVGRTVLGNWPATFQHYDTDGTLLFSAPGYKYVWGCHATADGQFAVVDAKSKTARIYDATGTAVWENKDLPGDPSDIKILDNGNRLITLSTPSRVIELDPENNIVWKIDFPGRTRSTTAERLPNGNTLVNLQFGKKVVEVNPDGDTVWELTGLKNCLTVQSLPDGNVLVCEMSEAKAIEYNREGEIVWEKGGFNNACQAQRLPNGNTLISDEKGIHEIDPEGNEVSNLPVKRGRFWRY